MSLAQVSPMIWQSLSTDQQHTVIELLARLAVKVVLPATTSTTQEQAHGLSQ